MKIGYSFGPTEGNAVTGINSVINGVARELLRLDKINQYYALGENYLNLPLITDFIPVLSIAGAQLKLPNMLCYLKNIELMHSYYYAYDQLPRGCKSVLTIYDLTPIVYMKEHPQQAYYNGPLKRAAHRADKIIAISEHTKKDIVECYNVSAEKVEVIYIGFNKELNILSSKPDASIIKEYGLEEGYLLSVCTLDPRKNLKGLVDAFIAFKEMYKKSKLKLVLIGKGGWDASVNKKLSDIIGNREDIILTGYVDNSILAVLYRNALAIAYVSFYEGFGLPILEAMQFGRAVICSDTSAMPEVGGDAVVYCNPKEQDSIVAAIETIVFNDTKRCECEEKGLLQVQKFSYRKAAKETLELYRSLGAE